MKLQDIFSFIVAIVIGITQLCIRADAAASPIKVFYNGKIRISHKERTDWIAIQDGKVLAFGKGMDFQKLNPGRKENLKGRFVLPGLTDSHVHLDDIGAELFEVDVSSSMSARDAVRRVRSHIEKNPGSAAVFGNGWDLNQWKDGGLPERALLDDISTQKPIVLRRADRKAAWANTIALQKTGLWHHEKDPPGSIMVRDGANKLTGVVFGAAVYILDSLRSKPPEDVLEQRIRRAVNQATRYGITATHNVSSHPKEISIIRKLLEKNEIRFRFYEMVSPENETDLGTLLKQGIVVDHFDGQLTVRTIKIYLDGHLVLRAAALEKPYFAESHSGTLLMDFESFVKKIKEADKHGFQVAVHAMGDRAVRLALNGFEQALGDKIREQRPRIEHASLISAQDIKRLSQRGLIVSMQPSRGLTDMAEAQTTFREEQLNALVPWKSLVASGCVLAFGSDAPSDSFNPWVGMLAAVLRKPTQGKPVLPEEHLGIEEAFQAYTEGAAFAGFKENSEGSLERGKWADFIITSNDPLTLSPEKLGSFVVDETYVGGIRVWPRK